MADESTKKSPAKDAPAKETSSEAGLPEQVVVAPPRVYAVSRLIEEAEGFLDVQSHVAAGALYGLDAALELEVADAKQRVDRWLASEVVA